MLCLDWPSAKKRAGYEAAHGEGEACKTKAFFSEFEELSIAEGRMILLLVNSFLPAAT